MSGHCPAAHLGTSQRGLDPRNNTFSAWDRTPLLECGTQAVASPDRSPGPPTCIMASGWRDSVGRGVKRQPAASSQHQPGWYRFRLLSVLLLVGVGRLSTPLQPLGPSTQTHHRVHVSCVAHPVSFRLSCPSPSPQPSVRNAGLIHKILPSFKELLDKVQGTLDAQMKSLDHQHLSCHACSTPHHSIMLRSCRNATLYNAIMP